MSIAVTNNVDAVVLAPTTAAARGEHTAGVMSPTHRIDPGGDRAVAYQRGHDGANVICGQTREGRDVASATAVTTVGRVIDESIGAPSREAARCDYVLKRCMATSVFTAGVTNRTGAIDDLLRRHHRVPEAVGTTNHRHVVCNGERVACAAVALTVNRRHNATAITPIKGGRQSLHRTLPTMTRRGLAPVKPRFDSLLLIMRIQVEPFKLGRSQMRKVIDAIVSLGRILAARIEIFDLLDVTLKDLETFR